MVRHVSFSFPHVHWCFACIYISVRVLDPLELELWTIVSCHVETGIEPQVFWKNLGLLEEQPVFLTPEPSLQAQGVFLGGNKSLFKIQSCQSVCSDWGNETLLLNSVNRTVLTPVILLVLEWCFHISPLLN